MRDPEAIGEYLLYQKESFFPNLGLSGVYDERRRTVDMFQCVSEADGVYVGPLERYGNPLDLPESYTNVEADGLTPKRRST